MGTVITNLDTLIDTLVSDNVSVVAANTAISNAEAAVITAAASASVATSKATEAGNSALSAIVSESNAAQSVVDAAGQATIATNKAGEALASATLAEDARVVAEQHRDTALYTLAQMNVKYDEFDDRYLGAHWITPTLDNDGETIQEGALYWNATTKALYVHTGALWVSTQDASGGILAINNLADLLDFTVARSNLDVLSSNEVNNLLVTKYDKTGGTVSGNMVVTGTVDLGDPLVTINYGELGAGVTTGAAGIEIERGTLTNYQIKFDEVDDTLKVGMIGALQKVATREDTPTNSWYATWDTATSKFNTTDLANVAMTMTNKTLDDITNSIGADHVHYKVKNLTGVTLVKGKVISFAGFAEDDVIRVKLYQPGDIALGIVHADILHGEIGLVVNTGRFNGYDTSLMTTFEVLYPTTNGVLTNVKPSNGSYQAAAVVIKSGPAGSGALLVEFTHPIIRATTAIEGVVTLSNSYVGTSQVLATTEKAVSDAVAFAVVAGNNSVVPQGNLSSNTVQSALEELQLHIDSFTADVEW